MTAPAVPGTEATAEPWRDPSRPVAERVADLLGRMTLAEKLAQLGSVWVGASGDGDGVAPMQHEFSTEMPPLEDLLQDGIGQLTRVFGTRPVPPAAGMLALAGLQQRIMMASRFGIPAIAHEECLTGFAAWSATIFPAPLSWGASFDPDLVRDTAAAIGASMRACGVHQCLAPVLDVTRDPAVGPHRGDHRRGPVSGRYHRHRVRARPPVRRGGCDAQALRRLLGLSGRAEHGAGVHRQARVRGRDLAAVRDGHPAGRRPLGDAGLHRPGQRARHC
jgi:hypothetical protein